MSSFSYKGSLTMKMNRCEAFGSIHNTELITIAKRAITIHIFAFQ